MKRNASIILAYLLPRMQDFVFIMVFLFGILLGPRFFGDGDTGRHIVVGNIVVAERYIPMINIFSHTKSGLPLTTTEWLSEAVYAVAYLAMGLNGAVLLSVILIAVTFTLVFRETLLSSQSYLISFSLVFLMVLATLFHWMARPHLFSWLLFAIWLPLMDRLARGETKNYWQFPLLMLLWVNLHGGFVLGFLVWGAYITSWLMEHSFREVVSSELFKRLLFAGVLSLLVTLLNPSGIGLWKNVFGHVGDSDLMNLHIEWQSPNFHDPNTWPFLLMIALLVFSFSRSSHPILLARSFIAAGLLILGLYSVRNIPYAVIACVPMLGIYDWGLMRLSFFQRVEQKLHVAQVGLRGAVWSLLSVIAIASLLISGQTLDLTNQGNRFDPALFPVHAVDWLSAHPQPGNVFNEFTAGGYILFRLWPEQKVFIDGQTDFYGAELVKDYLTMLNAHDGWEGLFAKYQIDWVLLPRDVPLVKILKSNSQWRILYEDDVSIILRK
jgi:hypothetical protein